jgi:hypothetical protein
MALLSLALGFSLVLAAFLLGVALVLAAFGIAFLVRGFAAGFFHTRLLLGVLLYVSAGLAVL